MFLKHIKFFNDLKDSENIYLSLLYFILKGSVKQSCLFINKNYFKVCERTLWNRLKVLKSKGYIKTSRKCKYFGVNSYEFAPVVDNYYKNIKYSKEDIVELKNKLHKLGIDVPIDEIVATYDEAKQNKKVVNAIAYTIATFKRKYKYKIKTIKTNNDNTFKHFSTGLYHLKT